MREIIKKKKTWTWTGHVCIFTGHVFVCLTLYTGMLSVLYLLYSICSLLNSICSLLYSNYTTATGIKPNRSQINMFM
jgi:hypothetical protein